MNRFILVMIIAFTVFTNQFSAQIYPEMIKVEGGSFIMGKKDEFGTNGEPQFLEVTINTFHIGSTPITVRQYKTYCQETGVKMPVTPWCGWNDDHPIVNLNYPEVEAYIHWLSATLNRTFRLPTEAEWEYAARGGNKSMGYLYSGSNDFEEVAICEETKEILTTTSPVAIRKPNELGIYDMSGNVWEWCSSWYTEGTYETRFINYQNSGTHHILKGGSWQDGHYASQVHYWHYALPQSWSDRLGFRVVSIEEEKPTVKKKKKDRG